jgi:hypothetical protein
MNAADARTKAIADTYSGVLAAAEVRTASTTVRVMESIRPDFRCGSQIHP